jgi:hypothetical protein
MLKPADEAGGSRHANFAPWPGYSVPSDRGRADPDTLVPCRLVGGLFSASTTLDTEPGCHPGADIRAPLTVPVMPGVLKVRVAMGTALPAIFFRWLAASARSARCGKRTGSRGGSLRHGLKGNKRVFASDIAGRDANPTRFVARRSFGHP